MKKRQKNTLNADLLALLAAIREQIDDTFEDYGVEPNDDDDGDDGEDCSGEEDD